MIHRPETLQHAIQRLEKVRKQRDLLQECCVEFVRKVECGEARSRNSYNQMKSALELCKKEGDL